MRYQHTSLDGHDSIRLLILSAGSGNDELQGSLRHAKITDPGEYEAISYVWGSEEKPFSLGTSEGSIELTESLYNALRDLRFSDRPRTLWVDAICINQKDSTEKAIQVSLMGRIYGSAKHALVYLGEEAEQSNAAYDLLEEMASPLWRDSSVEGEQFRSSFAQRDLSPIAAMMNRPWWQRMWIIQEFINSRDVYMITGSRQIHWKILIDAVDRVFSFKELSLSNYRKQYPEAYRGIIAFSTLDMGRDRSATSLLELLDLYQSSHATRKRDRLFALLPLATDASDPRFKPDYEEHLERVVRRYAAAFVDQGKIFHLLGTSCPDLSVVNPKFPSWIRDWTARRLFRDPEGVSTWNTINKAAGSTDPQASYDRQTDTLKITGYLIDRIKTIVHGPQSGWEDKPHTSSNSSNIADYVEQCLCLLLAPRTKNTTEQPHDTLRRTLTLNRSSYGDELDEESNLEMETTYNSTVAAFNTKANIPSDPPPDDPQPTTVASDTQQEENLFQTTVSLLTDHLSFAVTNNGTACLVPTTSHIGDWTAIFHGCPVPFILRPLQVDDNGDVQTFRLVRKAYLHGFMDGEALRDNRFVSEQILLR